MENCLVARVSVLPAAADRSGRLGLWVVGSIAEGLLKPNAAAQVRQILNEGGTNDLDLRISGPWADCVRSVVKHPDGTFEYVVNPEHLEFEVPCTPCKSNAERARLVDYAKRNWSNCPAADQPPSGCHTTYHFEDVAIQRNDFERSFRGPTTTTSSR